MKVTGERLEISPPKKLIFQVPILLGMDRYWTSLWRDSIRAPKEKAERRNSQVKGQGKIKFVFRG